MRGCVRETRSKKESKWVKSMLACRRIQGAAFPHHRHTISTMHMRCIAQQQACGGAASRVGKVWVQEVARPPACPPHPHPQCTTCKPLQPTAPPPSAQAAPPSVPSSSSAGRVVACRAQAADVAAAPTSSRRHLLAIPSLVLGAQLVRPGVASAAPKGEERRARLGAGGAGCRGDALVRTGVAAAALFVGSQWEVSEHHIARRRWGVCGVCGALNASSCKHARACGCVRGRARVQLLLQLLLYSAAQCWGRDGASVHAVMLILNAHARGLPVRASPWPGARARWPWPACRACPGPACWASYAHTNPTLAAPAHLRLQRPRGTARGRMQGTVINSCTPLGGRRWRCRGQTWCSRTSWSRWRA